MELGFWQILLTPFSWLLKTIYELLHTAGVPGSYALALILFSLITKFILYPLSLKGKRSMIKMNALSGEQQSLQRKYGKDQNRYALEVQKLYQKEGVSQYGGCLWSLLPMPLLIGLFMIVRQPLSFFMRIPSEAVTNIATALGLYSEGTYVAGVNAAYAEIEMANMLTNPANMAAAQTAAGEFAERLTAIDFGFFGIDLSLTPNWKFWEGGITWGAVGLFLLPVVSAGVSVLSTMITNKTNKVAQGGNAPAQNNVMMYAMMPLMSLWFGFIMPAGVSIYWISNSVFSMLQEVVMGRHLKSEYEQAAIRRTEADALEKDEEKRRKLEAAEERARRIEEEKRNKGKKKIEKAPREGNAEASRDGLRAYARGRAYEPNRYGGVTPYGGGAPVPVRSGKEEPAPLESPDMQHVDSEGEDNS